MRVPQTEQKEFSIQFPVAIVADCLNFVSLFSPRRCLRWESLTTKLEANMLGRALACRCPGASVIAEDDGSDYSRCRDLPAICAVADESIYQSFAFSRYFDLHSSAVARCRCCSILLAMGALRRERDIFWRHFAANYVFVWSEIFVVIVPIPKRAGLWERGRKEVSLQRK